MTTGTTQDYIAPVNKLLTYGDCHGVGEWPNYLELGLTGENISELTRMATDNELNGAGSDSLEVWAPIHAWRALGQLRAEEAVEPLMSLFHELEDSDWVREELPTVYGMIGAAAIPALAEYLADASHGLFPRITATHSLEQIGSMHPEAREQCVSVLNRQLERYTGNDATLNGFIISYLLNLHSVESMPVMQKAFEKHCVDLTIAGDLEEVEIDLGLRESRSTPRNFITPLEGIMFPELKTVPLPVSRKKIKIGRNDPCPCGSGKKYKKCCLNK